MSVLASGAGTEVSAQPGFPASDASDKKFNWRLVTPTLNNVRLVATLYDEPFLVWSKHVAVGLPGCPSSSKTAAGFNVDVRIHV